MNNLEKLQIPTPQDQQWPTDREHIVTVNLSNDFNPLAMCTQFANIVNDNLHPNQSSGQVKEFDFKNTDGGIELTAKFRCLASAHSAYKKLGEWAKPMQTKRTTARISAHTNKI